MTHPTQRQALDRLSVALMASVILHFAVLAVLHNWQFAPASQALLSDSVSDSGGRGTPLEVDLAPLHAVAPVAAAPNVGPASAVAEPLRAPATVASGKDASIAKRVAAAPDVEAAPVAGRASGIAEHAAPHFFGPRDVDLRAYPLNRPPIDDFTSQYYSQDEVVRLRVFVGADGHVDHIDALPETTAPPDFVEHMKASIDATQFVPATRTGVPVNSYFDVDLSIQSSRPPLKVMQP